MKVSKGGKRRGMRDIREHIIDTTETSDFNLTPFDGYNEIWGEVREEIVRCKDCVDCTEEGIYTPQYYCCSRHWNYQSWQGTPTEPDGFCKWGKRKKQ